LKKKQLFLGAREELINLNLELLDTQEDITNSINLLHEIALNKRVRGYNISKEEKKMLREVYKGENKSLIEIREFVEKEIKKYCDINVDSLDDINKNQNCLIF